MYMYVLVHNYTHTVTVCWLKSFLLEWLVFSVKLATLCTFREKSNRKFSKECFAVCICASACVCTCVQCMMY